MKTSKTTPVLYAKQPRKPEWFDESNPMHLSATSGSSPFNEWYAFQTRRDAVEWLRDTNPPQPFVDKYILFNNDYYEWDAFTPESVETMQDADDLVLKPGAEPADLSDLVADASRF